MKALTIYQDEFTGTYTIEIDNEVMYECLAADEVAEIINEILGGETK